MKLVRFKKSDTWINPDQVTSVCTQIVGKEKDRQTVVRLTDGSAVTLSQVSMEDAILKLTKG